LKKLDLSKERSPKRAAERLVKWLKKNVEAETAHVVTPERWSEIHGGKGVWGVMWEGGPYEWAIAVSMGSDIFAGEFNRWSKNGDVNVMGNPHWVAEPYWSFDLGFYS